MLVRTMTLTTSQLGNDKLLANCNPMSPKVGNLDLGVCREKDMDIKMRTKIMRIFI